MRHHKEEEAEKNSSNVLTLGFSTNEFCVNYEHMCIYSTTCMTSC